MLNQFRIVHLPTFRCNFLAKPIYNPDATIYIELQRLSKGGEIPTISFLAVAQASAC
jgi:hypothetical protein